MKYSKPKAVQPKGKDSGKGKIIQTKMNKSTGKIDC